jgi:hypothetical protein
MKFRGQEQFLIDRSPSFRLEEHDSPRREIGNLFGNGRKFLNGGVTQDSFRLMGNSGHPLA